MPITSRPCSKLERLSPVIKFFPVNTAYTDFPDAAPRVHDLRHNFAHNYLKSGGEMYELKAILGHKSIQMTVDLYGNFQAEDVSKVSPYEF